LSGQLELKQEVSTTITMWMDKTNRIIVDDRIYTYQNDKAKHFHYSVKHNGLSL
jgi:hypothetical protein